MDDPDPLQGLVGDWSEPVERTVERSTTETLLGHVYEHSAISEDEFDVLLDLVAHEIRTPFALIEGQARLLLEGAEDGGGELEPELVRSIHRNSILGLLLLERLTDLRAVDEGRISLNRLHLDVVTHVRRTIEILGDVVLGFRPVEVNVEDEPVNCDVDPGRLRQIVFNLLANAVLNTPPGAPINVEVRRRNGAAEVVVRDDGHGVAPEEADEVFEKFPSLDAARQGPGVGLYVSRGLARAHGGDLHTLSPEDSEGGIFVLSLPCDPPG